MPNPNIWVEAGGRCKSRAHVHPTAPSWLMDLRLELPRAFLYASCPKLVSCTVWGAKIPFPNIRFEFVICIGYYNKYALIHSVFSKGAHEQSIVYGKYLIIGFLSQIFCQSVLLLLPGEDVCPVSDEWTPKTWLRFKPWMLCLLNYS